MQIALNGLQKSHGHPSEFPYEALNPISARKETFNSLEDVNEVLVECYNNCIDKGYKRLGEALYNQSLFIVKDFLLLDNKMQYYIKQYRFCKNFNCPPYPSLQDTPIKTIDSFMVIDQEIEQFKTKDNNG